MAWVPEGLKTHHCHPLSPPCPSPILPSPNDNKAANTVPNPLVPYQAATLKGCSPLVYQCPVITLKSGKHPPSNTPKKNLAVMSWAKSLQNGVAVCARPHPKTKAGISTRCGNLTISHEETGWMTSWAIGAMAPTREYWLPRRSRSSGRPKMALKPRTVLSRIWRKYTQMRRGRMMRSILRRTARLWAVSER